jgi:hypothetical protein
MGELMGAQFEKASGKTGERNRSPSRAARVAGVD